MKSSSRAVNNRRSKSASTVLFPIAPAPFVDESPISWVQRLCGEHHLTYPTMEKLLSYWPKKDDWDCDVNQPRWRHLCSQSGMKGVACSVAFSKFQVISDLFGQETWQLQSRKKPSYSWCVSCWRDDEVPYLRWSWRLRKVRTCDIHRVVLSQQCPWCNSQMALNRALLTNGGAYPGVPNLSYCCSCGMPMADASVDVEKEAIRSEIDFCWDSWNFMEQHLLELQKQVAELQGENSDTRLPSKNSPEEQVMLELKLVKTKKSARFFMNRFFSDEEATP